MDKQSDFSLKAASAGLFYVAVKRSVSWREYDIMLSKCPNGY
jgi:hypothetical protein